MSKLSLELLEKAELEVGRLMATGWTKADFARALEIEVNDESRTFQFARFIASKRVVNPQVAERALYLCDDDTEKILMYNSGPAQTLYIEDKGLLAPIRYSVCIPDADSITGNNLVPLEEALFNYALEEGLLR